MSPADFVNVSDLPGGQSTKDFPGVAAGSMMGIILLGRTMAKIR